MASQPPRQWYRLASLARMEAAEAAAAAATAGTAINPPVPRIPIGIRPPPQQATPTPQQPTLPQPQTTSQPQLMPQPQLAPLQQQAAPPQQQPAVPQKQPTPTQQLPAPPQQQPTLPQQLPALPQQQMILPQQQPAPPHQQPVPPQQPAPPQQQPAPPQQQPAPPQQQLTQSPFPPRTPTPPPPVQAETQPALTVTPLNLQSDIQTMTPATLPEKGPQQPSPPLGTAMPLETLMVIKTFHSTPPPSPMAGKQKTTPIQPSGPNMAPEQETKSPSARQHKTFPVTPEEKSTPRIHEIQNSELEPETKLPLPPKSKTFSVAAEEKTVDRIRPPLHPESAIEPKPSPAAQSPKSSSAAPEKKMSIDDNRSRPNNDKLPGSATETKEEKQLKVITMAGENTGATMEFDFTPHRRGGQQGVGHKVQEDGNRHDRMVEQEEHAAQEKGIKTVAVTKPMATIVNSNVQGINNSIVFNSSCTQHSPGVHITFIVSRNPPNATIDSSSHKAHRSHHH